LKYVDWLKTQPCCNPRCKGFGGDVVPAHQRILGRGGVGMKPPDEDALPLCVRCHHEEHRGAVTFWGCKDKAETKEFVRKLCDKHIRRYEIREFYQEQYLGHKHNEAIGG